MVCIRYGMVVDVRFGGSQVLWMSGVVNVLFWPWCGGYLVWWMSVWWMSCNLKSLCCRTLLFSYHCTDTMLRISFLFLHSTFLSLSFNSKLSFFLSPHFLPSVNVRPGPNIVHHPPLFSFLR